MPEENKEKTQKKRWTLKKVKTRCRTIYWQNFLLTASVVMLTLALLGSAFFALTYSYAIDERSEQMQSKATVVSHMVSSYMENGSLTGLRELADFASNVTDAEFLICNSDGNLLLTTDTTLVNRVLTVPQDVAEGAMSDDTYAVRTTLGDIYEDTHFVVGVPIVSEGATVGFVLAVTGARALTTMWRTFIGLFFMTAVTVLLLSFVVSAWVSMRQSRPIHEMAEATRRFAEGNFDVRMHNYEGVTEISELAESFNNMADSLQETERQRREFIANVSHELKTPMTTIAGYTDGILDGTIPPEQEKEYLRIISDEARRLSRLVRRMLEVSQLQSRDLTRTKAPFDVCESMRRVLISMEKKITDRGLDVDADIPDSGIMVLGDNDLITQVIYNLLENAAKFARKGSALYLGVTTLNGVAAMPDFGELGNVMFNLDFKGVFTASGLILVFVCFFGDFFSTLGTVLAVANRANMLDENGNLPGIERPFLVDAIGTCLGALTGNTTITTFVESTSGVEAGGRTGLTALVTGIMFLLTIFLAPLFVAIPYAATGPALIYVGFLMLKGFTEIDFTDFDDAIGPCVMMMFTAFTGNITNGLGAGIIVHVLVKLVRGKAKEIHPIMYLLCALMVLYFIVG